MEFKIKLDNEEEYENLLVLLQLQNISLTNLFFDSQRLDSLKHSIEKIIVQLEEQWEEDEV